MKKFVFLLLFAALLLSSPARATPGYLAIRDSVTGAEFYDTSTGKGVLLNGVNYQRFSPYLSVINFRVGDYDHSANAAMMDDIKTLKFNAVRVVIAVGQAYTGGYIDPNYISNITDFLFLAQEKDIFVLFIVGFIPGDLLPAPHPDYESSGFNEYLNPEYADAKGQYMIDLFSELINQGAPLEKIAGVEIENEPWFDLSKKPFTLYGTQAEKHALIDIGFVYYMDTVRAAIKSVAPDLLVGMSLASPMAWAISGKFFRSAALMNNSQADFFGINIYPPFTTVDQNMISLGMTVNKPLIISEYGAYKANYPTVTAAINALVALKVETCTQYNFRGWFLYPWDSYEIQPTVNLWMGTEQGLAAGVTKPDPCSATIPATVGRVDSVSLQGVVSGFIADPDAIYPTTINFWEGGTYRGTVSLRSDRPDLFHAYTWPPFPVGWKWRPPASLMSDGLTHILTAWAADRNPNGTFGSFLLTGQNPFTLPKY